MQNNCTITNIPAYVDVIDPEYVLLSLAANEVAKALNK